MLETKIKNLIDKHQKQADDYHRIAKFFSKNDLSFLCEQWDKKAHPHEAFALELRMILK